MSNVLILVEHAEGKAKKSSLAGIRFGQLWAEQSHGELHLLVVGNQTQNVVEELKSFQATKIIAVDHENFTHYTTEGYTSAIVQAAQHSNAKYIGGATSSTTKDVLPRVAARLDAAMASDVMTVIDSKTFTRPMWAGNVIATVNLTTDIAVCTARGTEFDPPTSGEVSQVETLDVTVDLTAFKTQFVALKEIKSERPELTTADRIVSGGRGCKGEEGFKLVEGLADYLKAGVGATRAAVDAGWIPNDLQVGQTGKVVAPDLYIAVGISGAIQHLAGMKSSKTIVAINKDPEAPIFQVADYGLVTDLFKAVPELLEELKKG